MGQKARPPQHQPANAPGDAAASGGGSPPLGATQADSAPPLLEQEVQRLTRELQQAKEQYVRTLAEFDNARKRLHREKEEFVRYAAEAIVGRLLPIVDSLDHALAAVDKVVDPQAVVKGVQLIHRQLLDVLEREGIKRILSVGEAFDPNQHEAIAQVETKDGMAENTVVEEIQVGYTLHGKVLRPAMVKVAKKSSPQSIVDSP
ncbi:MAG: nucleotide exchange factor GrpE [Candidatus Omnitrophota bacterium]|nr:nucleotide exchange factor GrpE [Candidatus Omnitrophota bacterium]